jgi:hypothetical protein
MIFHQISKQKFLPDLSTDLKMHTSESSQQFHHSVSEQSTLTEQTTVHLSEKSEITKMTV